MLETHGIICTTIRNCQENNRFWFLWRTIDILSNSRFNAAAVAMLVVVENWWGIVFASSSECSNSMSLPTSIGSSSLRCRTSDAFYSIRTTRREKEAEISGEFTLTSALAVDDSTRCKIRLDLGRIPVCRNSSLERSIAGFGEVLVEILLNLLRPWDQSNFVV